MEQKTKQLVTIENVHGYVDENGTVWLNVEDVARGLGFSEPKGGIEYVKWSRVNRYLQEFGFSTQVSKDDFIPENIFYRLAMKAKNEVAQNFQAKVADEILPQIRKTGFYTSKPLTDLEILERQVAVMKQQDKRISTLETSVADINKRLDHETKVNALTDHLLDVQNRKQQKQIDQNTADIKQLKEDNFVVKEDISTDIKGFINKVFDHYPHFYEQGQKNGKAEVYRIFYGAVSEGAGHSSTYISTLISERRKRLISQGLSEVTAKQKVTGITVINSDVQLRTAAMGVIKNVEDIMKAEGEN